MKMKKILSLFLAAGLVLSLAACKPKAPVEEETNPRVEENIQEEEPMVEEEEEVKKVKLYFANEAYINTGDGGLDPVIEVEREVDPEEKPMVEVILEELKKEPEDENLSTILNKIKVLGVETKDHTAYVNISSENLYGGSLEESLILNQIVFSLTALEEVEQVQILVDGNKRETLMGHIMIEEPLKRSDLK